jgi:hypothetical protein
MRLRSSRKGKRTAANGEANAFNERNSFFAQTRRSLELEFLRHFKMRRKLLRSVLTLRNSRLILRLHAPDAQARRRSLMTFACLRKRRRVLRAALATAFFLPETILFAKRRSRLKTLR